MSIKHPKVKLGLKIVITVMFGLVVFNATQDYREYEGGVRRLSALSELQNINTDAHDNVLQVVKR